MLIKVQRQQGACHIDVHITGSAHGIVALYGASGAGKTSVINMVAGLLRPDSGIISINGQCLFDAQRGVNVPPENRHIGYVFQEGRLFPHLSVQRNLLYGQKRVTAEQKVASPQEVIALLGLEHLLHRMPKHLSGGEKQRVALGRAVLSAPKLLLMDEPLASLDAERKDELLPFIKQLNTVFQIPVLYVSHSLDEIHRLTSQVVRLAYGRVVASV